MNLPPIFERQQELTYLAARLRQPRNLLLHGPAGVGKTLLIRHASAGVPNVLYCENSGTTQQIFRSLAGQLVGGGVEGARKIFGEDGSRINSLSSASLRGAVAQLLRSSGCSIVLDHIKCPSQQLSAAIRELSGWGSTPLVVVARSAHMEDVGFLLPLFPDRSERYEVSNFHKAGAHRFASKIAEEICLKAENQDELISKAVEFSNGNPGAILAILKMAMQPKYFSAGRVKLAPLYIDFRLSWGN